ncbi:ubiquitinyl hydrolase [Gautieria morchelliformis]|nr:ubiquitinyl hydrolase [Gautieria morchelliformis]
MSCPHLSQLSQLPEPRLSQPVHREECTQCFDNQDLPQGIDVCLTCFNGGCINSDPYRKHARLHHDKLGHAFSLNVRRTPKPSTKRDDLEPPLKKLAIIEERDEDKYDHETILRCWSCDESDGKLLPELSNTSDVRRLTTAIMQSMSSARQSEVKAWEEEITPCEHTLMLQQSPTGSIPASGLAHCLKCDLKDNLWLCLTCGALGCGRQQYGGLGGNGHGLEHYTETAHPVSVKLGTITPEGNADIHCYICHDSKLDPELAVHLSSFGINIATQTKTEKSLTELQIEQNLKFDFSLTGDDGKALEPTFGPGLTGLSNLGNSCYMASTLQTVFSLPAFRSYYLDSYVDHAQTCNEPLPSSCIDCQMRKVADGLLSGRYSLPRSHLPTSSIPPPASADDPLHHPSPTPVFQEGIKPSMFKTLIGKGHEEFATMRQQDAEEFFAHLMKVLRQQAKRVGGADEAHPTDVFKFGVEQRLQCGSCGGVRYRVDAHDDLSIGVPAVERALTDDGKPVYASVKLTDCLDVFTGVEEIEYRCPKCAKNVVAKKRTLLSTFPDVLLIHAKKFQLVTWVPTKLDIPLEVPSDDLFMDAYLATGLQDGEQVLHDDAPDQAAPSQPEFNQLALAQLEAMGFPLVRCQKALLATGNSDPEAAMEWLFGHMEDPDIDTPLQAAAPRSASAPEPAPEQIAMLADMGFTAPQARKALKETDGNVERAVEWLFSHPDDAGEPDGPAPSSASAAPHPGGNAALPARYRLKAFISHKGPSVHSGHYVAHVRTDDLTSAGSGSGEGEWVLFNDEKVVKADAESVRDLKKLAYLYVFQRLT